MYPEEPSEVIDRAPSAGPGGPAAAPFLVVEIRAAPGAPYHQIVPFDSFASCS